MPQLKIHLPEDIDFASLHLSRDPLTRQISFESEPIEALCERSGIDPEIFLNGPQINVAALLAAWYAEHLRSGGPRDPVADQIFIEAITEAHYGEAHVQPGAVTPQ
jgi:hypothetical protein